MHDYLRQPFGHTRLPAALAALAATTIIAACGSSSPTVANSSATASSRPSGSSSSSGSGSSSTGSALPFSKCMRANGVPNFPDLSNNRMRIEASGQTISVNGVSVSVRAFTAARQKCEKYMPHASGTPTPAQAAQEHQQDLKFASCMRTHGVPNYPDPKVISSSNGNQTAYLPGINPSAPAFQTAAKACGGFNPKGP